MASLVIFGETGGLLSVKNIKSLEKNSEGRTMDIGRLNEGAMVKPILYNAIPSCTKLV